MNGARQQWQQPVEGTPGLPPGVQQHNRRRGGRAGRDIRDAHPGCQANPAHAWLPVHVSTLARPGSSLALDHEMQQAQLLELSDPAQAAAVWASVDHQLTDAAVWVPTVTLRDVELTSRRLGNYQYNPVWGFLADQSWIR